MSGHIEFHPHAGSAIAVTSAHAQRIADLLGVSIEFRFNDVLCIARPGGTGEALAEEYSEEVGRKLDGPHDRRYASSTPRRARGRG